jgi:hypothetical protein
MGRPNRTDHFLQSCIEDILDEPIYYVAIFFNFIRLETNFSEPLPPRTRFLSAN